MMRLDYELKVLASSQPLGPTRDIIERVDVFTELHI